MRCLTSAISPPRSGATLCGALAQRSGRGPRNRKSPICTGPMRLEATAESPVQWFSCAISAATREWPMLAYPTRFDLGNARVVGLDVAALCGT